MDNPFTDLQKEREERDYKQRQEQLQRRNAQENSRRTRHEMAIRYNEIVTPLLEQLCQAAHPGSHIEPPHTLPLVLQGQPTAEEPETSWSIVVWESFSHPDDGSDISTEVIRLTITLEFGSDDRPTHFRCHRRWGYQKPNSRQSAESEWVFPKPILADLSREALIRALKQLHPPGSF